MNLKKIVKSISPPILLEAYRRFQYGSGTEHYFWEGVYKHYRDVPIAGEGHDGDTWVGIARKKTETVLAKLKTGGSIPKEVTGDESLLPLLASVAGANSKHIRILDFGGGMGIDYVYVRNSLAACQSVDYYVVESEMMCRQGKLLFEGDDRIHFCERPPQGLTNIDIIHMDSVLQYVEDYSALLSTLCAYRPKYFLFVRLSAGDISTYATAQTNVPGITLAYWFINVNEIIESMSANRYSLVFKSAGREYDQGNFPEQHRLGRTCNLLFVRD